MASSSSSPPEEEANEKGNLNLADLPRDVTLMILQNLSAIDILRSAQKVCTTWRSICKEPAMWRHIDVLNGKLGEESEDLRDEGFDLEKIARHAVDRSCGQLVSIVVKYFGSDEFLQYIAERGSQLKSLLLVHCYGISSEGLSEAAKKLPLLEELHIYYGSISKEALEAVGRCCPQLKSLTFNNWGYRGPDMECDESAQAIAKSMPGLRHLRLFGNGMTNDGLQAILDGCPDLESLDLRQCFNVNLGGPLGIRCSKQIKCLRRPMDSTKDYESDGFDVTVHDAFDDPSFDDDYPSGFSDIDFLSDAEDNFEFSGASDFSDYEEMFYDY